MAFSGFFKDIQFGFRADTDAPIDSRFIAADETARKGMPAGVLHNGLPVFQEDDADWYLLIDKDNPNNDDSWAIVSTGVVEVAFGALEGEVATWAEGNDTNTIPETKVPVLTTAKVPTLDAAKIGTGVLNEDRIPGLDADKITKGTIEADRIGTLRDSSIPRLDLSKLTQSDAAEGQVPVYRGSTDEWVPEDLAAAGDANVQSNWTETDINSDAFILNKPTTISSEQAADIVTNNAKVGITTGGQEFIGAKTIKSLVVQNVLFAGQDIADVFDHTVFGRIPSATDVTKLAGIEALADVTDKANVDTAIGASASGAADKFYNEQGEYVEVGNVETERQKVEFTLAGTDANDITLSTDEILRLHFDADFTAGIEPLPIICKEDSTMAIGASYEGEALSQVTISLTSGSYLVTIPIDDRPILTSNETIQSIFNKGMAAASISNSDLTWNATDSELTVAGKAGSYLGVLVFKAGSSFQFLPIDWSDPVTVQVGTDTSSTTVTLDPDTSNTVYSTQLTGFTLSDSATATTALGEIADALIAQQSGFTKGAVMDGTFLVDGVSTVSKYIDIDLDTTTNIAQSMTLAIGSGSNGDFEVQSFSDGNPGSQATTITVSDNAGTEVTSFTATSGELKDSIGVKIADAINSNEETPIDYTAVYDSTTDVVTLLSDYGNPDGDWTVTINHHGVIAANLGDLSVTSTKSTEELLSSSHIQSNEDGTAKVDIYNTSHDVANNDISGEINFYGKDTDGAKLQIGQVKLTVDDTTLGSEDTSLEFFELVDGTLTKLDLGGGDVNLTSTASATNVVVSAGSGTDATIAAADASNAGVVIPGAQNFGTGKKTFGGDVSIVGDVDVGGNTIFMSQNSKLEIFESGGGFDPDVQTSLFSQGLIESKQPDGESLAVLRVSQDTIGAISNSLGGHIGYLGFNAKKGSATDTARDYARCHGYAINALNVINPTNARGRFTIDVADGTENTDGDPNYVDLIDAQQSKIDLNTSVVNANGNLGVTGVLNVSGLINETISTDLTNKQLLSNKGMLITADKLANVDDAYLQLRVNAFTPDPAVYGSYVKHGRIGARALSSFDGEPFVVAETDTIPVVGTVLGGLLASAKGTTFDSDNADETHVYNDFGKIEAVSTSIVTTVASGVNTTIDSEWRVQPYKAGVAHTSLVVKPDEVIINNGSNTINLPKTRPTVATEGFPEWNTDGTFKGWAAGGGGNAAVTKASVDTAIGASASGDASKFYNEQGDFVTVSSGGLTDAQLAQLNTATATNNTQDTAIALNTAKVTFAPTGTPATGDIVKRNADNDGVEYGKAGADSLAAFTVTQPVVGGVTQTQISIGGTEVVTFPAQQINSGGVVNNNVTNLFGNGVDEDTVGIEGGYIYVAKNLITTNAGGTINYKIVLRRRNRTTKVKETIADITGTNTTIAAARTAFNPYDTLTKLNALTTWA